MQIGNQINATVSQNLIELQSQMASFNQAQMAFMLKKSQEDEMMRNRLDHVTENFEVSNEEPVRMGKW